MTNYISLSLKTISLILLSFVFYSAVSVFKERKRPGRSKEELYWPLWLSIAGIMLGTLLTALSLLPEKGIWLLCCLNIPYLFVLCIVVNQRIIWDLQGFWYRSSFRRCTRYEFSDISRVKRIRTERLRANRFGIDRQDILKIRVKNKQIILRDLLLWDEFAAEYDSWRIKNGLLPYQQEEEQRWQENYMRHGSFRRKLDRIPNGLSTLIIWLMFAFIVTGGGLFYLLTSNPTRPRDMEFFCAVAFVLIIGAGPFLTYLYLVYTMNTKVLRRFVRAKIHPDPDKPAKRYKRKS